MALIFWCKTEVLPERARTGKQQQQDDTSVLLVVGLRHDEYDSYDPEYYDHNDPEYVDFSENEIGKHVD